MLPTTLHIKRHMQTESREMKKIINAKRNNNKTWGNNTPDKINFKTKSVTSDKERPRASEETQNTK